MSKVSIKNKPRRILVARGDALGDMVLATVVIKPLRDLFPDAEIYFLARKEMIPLLEGTPEIAGVIENNLSYAWRWSELPAFFALCREISALSPDIFLGLWERRRYGFLSFFSGIPVRVGYAMSWVHRFLYTDVVSVDFSFFFTHQTVYNLALLAPLAIKEKKTHQYNPQLTVGCPASWIASASDRYPCLISSYVCVQIDGSAMQKTWLPETCVAVIRYLATKHVQVVLLGRPDEARRSTILAGVAALPNIVDLTDRLSLPDVTAVLSGSELFVGLDSGFAHLAGALNIPSVVYFLNRTQNALRWRPLGTSVHLVFSRHACPDKCVPSVCQKEVCREALLVKDLCVSIDSALSEVASPAISSLRQLTVAVISRNPEALLSFFFDLGVRAVVISPDLGIGEMARKMAASNVMWVVLDRVPYRLSYRMVRVLVSNHVMWPPLFAPVQGVSDVSLFLKAQGF